MHVGVWGLAAIVVVIVSWLMYRYLAPKSWKEWTRAGVLQAFIIAFYAEMYGFPLTLYLLAGWLGSHYPGLDPLSHQAGHLWSALLGWRGDPHLSPLHIVSSLLIAAGFILLASAWPVLRAAQRAGRLASTGPYARLRHPQYAAFVLIMLGFLLQWPTLLTLLMFPLLVAMYVRLARREEREALATYGEAYAQYAARVPAFLPRPGHQSVEIKIS